MEPIATAFGLFVKECQQRLELTFDYEASTIVAFKKIADHLHVECLLDVGANIGVYSIYCCDLPSLNAIHMFEPAEESYRLLCENIHLQSTDTELSAHKFAVSDSSGWAKFLIISPTSGANAILEDQAEGNAIDVRVDTIDNILDLRGKIVAVKIDVEGHERSVLKGMRDFLSGNQCFIQIEILDADKVSQISDFFSALGYAKVFRLRDDYLYCHESLSLELPSILNIIANSLATDLRDLMNLRREKRAVARVARKLREQTAYKSDPLFIALGQDPFEANVRGIGEAK